MAAPKPPPHGPPYSLDELEAERFALDHLSNLWISEPQSWRVADTKDGGSTLKVVYETATPPIWRESVLLRTWKGRNDTLLLRARINFDHVNSLLSGAETPGFAPFVRARLIDGFAAAIKEKADSIQDFETLEKSYGPGFDPATTRV